MGASPGLRDGREGRSFLAAEDSDKVQTTQEVYPEDSDKVQTTSEVSQKNIKKYH